MNLYKNDLIEYPIAREPTLNVLNYFNNNENINNNYHDTH